jgi:hypothetical protein
MRRPVIAGFVILAILVLAFRLTPASTPLKSPSWWPGHPPPPKRYQVLAIINISIRTTFSGYHEGPAKSDIGFLDALERLEKTHKTSSIDRGLYDNVMGNFAANIIMIDEKTDVIFQCQGRGSSLAEAFDEAVRLAKEHLNMSPTSSGPSRSRGHGGGGRR